MNPDNETNSRKLANDFPLAFKEFNYLKRRNDEGDAKCWFVGCTRRNEWFTCIDLGSGEIAEFDVCKRHRDMMNEVKPEHTTDSGQDYARYLPDVAEFFQAAGLVG